VWAGIPEIGAMYLAAAAGAADMPATVLLGKSPDGMNATGEGDQKIWENTVKARQDLDLRPCLDQLDVVLIPSALGKADPNIWWQFAPLSTLSEKDEATTFNTTMDALTKLQATASIPDIAFAKGVQNLLTERGWIPGLDAALAEVPEDERFPEDLAEPVDDVPDGNGKEADPNLAPGGGVGSAATRRRAANDARFTDATPRTLYVRRDVVNVAEIAAWAKSQGLPELQRGLHVTIAHIDQPFDWMKVSAEWSNDDKGQITVIPGGVRIVEALGDRTAVLLFTSSELSWRHESILRAAETQDRFPSYQPHVSLTGEPVDLSNVVPYRGKIVLSAEIFEEIRTDGA